MKKRVLIIGLDGATFDLMRPWMKEGKLPFFKRLAEAGASGDLKTVFGRTYYVFRNIQSFTSWTSFSTGMLSTRHGVYSVFKGRGLVSTKTIRGERLWSILSRKGYRVGVINLPVTYPPDSVNGFLISGLLTPPGSDNFTFPRELRKELKDYRVSFKVKNYPNVKHAEFLEDILDVSKKRVRTVLRLMKEKEWDFFLVNFDILDELQHFFWHFMDRSHPQYTAEGERKYGDVIFNAYKDMENVVKEMIRIAGKNTNVFVISDHGFGSKFKEFDLRTELKKEVCLRLGIIKKDAKVANHKPNGILMATGPDIAAGRGIEDANLIDIAPTVLHMFGLPVPIDMDGKVLKGVFKPSSEYRRRVEIDSKSKSVMIEKMKSSFYRALYDISLL